MQYYINCSIQDGQKPAVEAEKRVILLLLGLRKTLAWALGASLVHMPLFDLLSKFPESPRKKIIKTARKIFLGEWGTLENERLVLSASEIWCGSELTVSASLKVQIDLGYTLSINPGEAFNYVYLSLGIFIAMLAFWIGALGALNSLMILVFSTWCRWSFTGGDGYTQTSDRYCSRTELCNTIALDILYLASIFSTRVICDASRYFCIYY